MTDLAREVKKEAKVVVITGGTSGIGKALVDYFRGQGEVVCNLARSSDETVENNYICDVSDEAAVFNVFDKIGKKYGRIDLLINNAGYGISGAMELLSTDGVNKNMDVNFFGSLYCSRAALPYMKRGAKIINISSACALFALPFRAMYCASKAAVNMMSFGMRMELEASGVDVCCVCPGDIKTEFTANRAKEHKTSERYGERIKRAAEKIDSKNDKRMPVSVVVKAVARQANRKKTKPLVIVGAAFKFFYLAQRLLPTRFFLRIITKYFGGF